MKKYLTKENIIIITVVVALIIACIVWIAARPGGNPGSDSDSSVIDKTEPPKTTEDLMKRAAEELSSVESFQFDSNMSMTLSSEGETMDMIVSVTQFFNRNSDVGKVISSMTMGNMGSYSTTSYIEKKGENYNVYSSSDGGIQWTKETAVSADELPVGDPSESLLPFLTGIDNYKKSGDEEIAGVKTTRYECVVSSEEMEETLKNSGALDQLSGEEISEKDIKEICSKLEGLKFSVWIGKDDYRPYRFFMDMGNLLTTMSELSGQDEESQQTMEMVDKVTMSYDITAYNQLDDIKVPKEAKNAEEA